jgi:hypothetical protein
MAALFHDNFQVDWTRAVCVVRPCDWEEDGHVALAEWGKKVAAAKDAAVEKYGRWDGHFYADIPPAPAGYFDNDADNYYLHQAIMASWKKWGKHA